MSPVWSSSPVLDTPFLLKAQSIDSDLITSIRQKWPTVFCRALRIYTWSTLSLSLLRTQTWLYIVTFLCDSGNAIWDMYLAARPIIWSGRPMFHHGSNMWTSRIFSDRLLPTPSASRGRPISTIQFFYVFHLFNICSLDASAVNSGLPVMIAYLPFLGDVVLRSGDLLHEYTLPLQRKGHR
jgi:hypothetical protein